MVGTITSVIAGKKKDGAIDDARGAQQSANWQANEKLGDAYETQRKDWAPYRAYGARALVEMEKPDKEFVPTEFNFEKNPGYEFRMAEGQKALERSASARGGLNSGATMKALANYGQNLASSEYGNAHARNMNENKFAYDRFASSRDARFGRLSYLAGVGQNANSYMSNAAQNYGTQLSNNIMGRGDREAASHLAKGQNQAEMWGGISQSHKDYRDTMFKAAGMMTGGMGGGMGGG